MMLYSFWPKMPIISENVIGHAWRTYVVLPEPEAAFVEGPNLSGIPLNYLVRPHGVVMLDGDAL